MANAIWDPAKGTYVPASPQAKAQAEKVYSNNTSQPRAVWNTNTGKYEPLQSLFVGILLLISGLNLILRLRQFGIR